VFQGALSIQQKSPVQIFGIFAGRMKSAQGSLEVAIIMIDGSEKTQPSVGL